MDERLLVKRAKRGDTAAFANCMGQFIRGCISLRCIRLEIHRMRRMWSVPL